jgi:GMP synthase (glutamine-hydrolysing)
MAQRLILVRHHSGPYDDRVTSWGHANGYEVVQKRPFEGEMLGDPDESVAASVIYGGRFNAFATKRHPFLLEEARWIEACMARGVKLLGICQGAQQIAHTLGAEVGPRPDGACEFGYYQIRPTEAGKALFPKTLRVAQSHFHTFAIPRGAELLASSAMFANQAFRCGEGTYAFQFHAEQTVDGFRRWQETSLNYGRPGAQTREEQDRAMADADAEQGEWFLGFLDGFFGRPRSLRAHGE